MLQKLPYAYVAPQALSGYVAVLVMPVENTHMENTSTYYQKQASIEVDPIFLSLYVKKNFKWGEDLF